MTASGQASVCVATAATAPEQASDSRGPATPTGSIRESRVAAWQIEGAPPKGGYTVRGNTIYLSKEAADGAAGMLNVSETHGYTWKARLVHIVGTVVA